MGCKPRLGPTSSLLLIATAIAAGLLLHYYCHYCPITTFITTHYYTGSSNGLITTHYYIVVMYTVVMGSLLPITSLLFMGSRYFIRVMGSNGSITSTTHYSQTKHADDSVTA